MFALSKSIPGGENTLGLSTKFLAAFRQGVGPLNHLIGAVLVPCTARQLAGGGSKEEAARAAAKAIAEHGGSAQAQAAAAGAVAARAGGSAEEAEAAAAEAAHAAGGSEHEVRKAAGRAAAVVAIEGGGLAAAAAQAAAAAASAQGASLDEAAVIAGEAAATAMVHDGGSKAQAAAAASEAAKEAGGSAEAQAQAGEKAAQVGDERHRGHYEGSEQPAHSQGGSLAGNAESIGAAVAAKGGSAAEAAEAAARAAREHGASEADVSKAAGLAAGAAVLAFGGSAEEVAKAAAQQVMAAGATAEEAAEIAAEVAGKAVLSRSNSHLATSLILFARFMVSILVPFAALYIFGEECHGAWLTLWSPCADSASSFDLHTTIPQMGNWNNRGCTTDGTGICLEAATFNITRHRDICEVGSMVPGQCSRFVIEGLGQLQLESLVTAAFVGPALMLLLSFPAVRQGKDAAIQCLFCNPNYTSFASLDTETAAVVMWMDLALIFGFAVPLVLPLLCLAFAGHLAVFHLAREQLGMQVKYDATPPCHYLLLSLVLGCGLNMAFFMDNEDRVAGAHLVYVGIPAGALAGLGIGAAWVRFMVRPHETDDSPSVQSPMGDLHPYCAMGNGEDAQMVDSLVN